MDQRPTAERMGGGVRVRGGGGVELKEEEERRRNKVQDQAPRANRQAQLNADHRLFLCSFLSTPTDRDSGIK